MELTYISYLLFVMPGFAFIWMYRHFTRAKQLGEFEYAAWSLILGSILFIGVMGLAVLQGVALKPIPLNDPAAALGSFVGTSLAVSTCAALPLGFIAAVLARRGWFRRLDNVLWELLVYLSR